MPLVLVPLVGAQPVPIIAISAIFTNLNRAIAYLRYADCRRALIVLVRAAPTTALGAYGISPMTVVDAFLQLQSGMSGLKCFGSTVEAGWRLHINGSGRRHAHASWSRHARRKVRHGTIQRRVPQRRVPLA